MLVLDQNQYNNVRKVYIGIWRHLKQASLLICIVWSGFVLGQHKIMVIPKNLDQTGNSQAGPAFYYLQQSTYYALSHLKQFTSVTTCMSKQNDNLFQQQHKKRNKIAWAPCRDSDQPSTL